MDLINMIVAYGGIVAYFFVFRRMLVPAYYVRYIAKPYGRIFALVILTAFICLFHISMTCSIDVMMLGIRVIVMYSNITNDMDKQFVKI